MTDRWDDRAITSATKRTSARVINRADGRAIDRPSDQTRIRLSERGSTEFESMVRKYVSAWWGHELQGQVLVFDLEYDLGCVRVLWVT